MVPRPKDLTNEERNQLAQFLLRDSKNGKPKYGKVKEAQEKFHISKSTVIRVWKAAQDQIRRGQAICLFSKKKGCSKTTKIVPDFPKIASLDLKDRRNLRRMHELLGVSRATLSRWYKAKILIAHTSSLRPCLTENNKYTRLLFSLQALEIDRAFNRLHFQAMQNVVHIDEKWFYITRGSNRYYLIPGEEEPYRACKSKKFIGKIMFLCAVSRPLLREDATVLFGGKIGIFPFTEQYTTLRGSKNRAKGTEVTRALGTINKQVMKHTLINKVSHNNYKIPHIGKDRMIRAGTLPLSLNISQGLAMKCVEFLISQGQLKGVQEIVLKLDLQQACGVEYMRALHEIQVHH